MNTILSFVFLTYLLCLKLMRASFRARLSGDLGADLAARLLNDKRSQFRTLLQQRAKCRVPMDDNQLFTVEIIENSYPEAAAVGNGMVAFFDKVLHNRFSLE